MKTQMKNGITKEQQLLVYINEIEENSMMFCPRIDSAAVVECGITANANSLYAMLGSLRNKGLVAKHTIGEWKVWVLTRAGAKAAAEAAEIAEELEERNSLSNDDDDDGADGSSTADDAMAAANDVMNIAFASMAKSFEAMSQSFAALAKFF